MAEILMGFFGDVDEKRKLAVCEFVSPLVAKVHYGIEDIAPGDITRGVTILDTSLSESDAGVEMKIFEGSTNWPSKRTLILRRRKLLSVGRTEKVLNERAHRISLELRDEFGDLSHNIFEYSGNGTGWVQYKPDGLDKGSEL